MRFSKWAPLAHIEEKAPPASGLFQVRVTGGLLSYPRGKSAMFYYGYAGNLSHGLLNFRKKILPHLEVNEEALLIRWMPTSDVETHFQRLLNSFYTNFGSMPLGNEMLLRKQNRRVS